ncbi:hypothetical protein B9T62_21440 [Paenibacillus donghaensis]|uniref:Uncharacterized protein n=1 Tax=Paenibacillus donghaensis TaxID=414771 RepID=A0A2Z2KIS6_9BACL|nr:hypothetical protein B9T62_21440 [Paenibacillus donghaensis]
MPAAAIEYHQGDGVIVPAPGTQVTGGAPYADGHIEFSIEGGSTAGEKLSEASLSAGTIISGAGIGL